MQPQTYIFVGSVVVMLSIAAGIGQMLKRQPTVGLDLAQVEQFNVRIQAWWLLCTVLATTFVLGTAATQVFFGILSFWSLREFITLTPTRVADHRPLFWLFVVFTPLQYVLVGMSDDARWGPLAVESFSVLIPVYGFLFIPARIALAGDYKRYLERVPRFNRA